MHERRSATNLSAYETCNAIRDAATVTPGWLRTTRMAIEWAAPNKFAAARQDLKGSQIFGAIEPLPMGPMKPRSPLTIPSVTRAVPSLVSRSRHLSANSSLIQRPLPYAIEHAAGSLTCEFNRMALISQGLRKSGIWLKTLHGLQSMHGLLLAGLTDELRNF